MGLLCIHTFGNFGKINQLWEIYVKRREIVSEINFMQLKICYTYISQIYLRSQLRIYWCCFYSLCSQYVSSGEIQIHHLHTSILKKPSILQRIRCFTIAHSYLLLSARSMYSYIQLHLLNIHLEKKKLHGLSPRANYTDRATAACRRSDCQLLRIEGAMWSAW
jgi:hypothetical protein